MLILALTPGRKDHHNLTTTESKNTSHLSYLYNTSMWLCLLYVLKSPKFYNTSDFKVYNAAKYETTYTGILQWLEKTIHTFIHHETPPILHTWVAIWYYDVHAVELFVQFGKMEKK